MTAHLIRGTITARPCCLLIALIKKRLLQTQLIGQFTHGTGRQMWRGYCRDLKDPNISYLHWVPPEHSWLPQVISKPDNYSSGTNWHIKVKSENYCQEDPNAKAQRGKVAFDWPQCPFYKARWSVAGGRKGDWLELSLYKITVSCRATVFCERTNLKPITLQDLSRVKVSYTSANSNWNVKRVWNLVKGYPSFVMLRTMKMNLKFWRIFEAPSFIVSLWFFFLTFILIVE